MAFDIGNFLSAGTLGAGKGLKNLLGGNAKNPADVASQNLSNLPPFLQMLFQNIGNRGEQSAGTLMDQYNKLINDPSSILSSLGKNYQQSPGYQFNKDQALSAASNAAAAGGMLGSPAHQQNAMDVATNLASKDYNDYLKNALGLFGTGLGGLEGFNQKGFQATEDFAKMIQDYFNSNAQLAYEGQAAKNQKNSDLLNKLFGIGSLALSAI